MSIEIELGCRTRGAILLLIKNSLEVQKLQRAIQVRDRVTPEQYLKEYCTVRISGPRVSGHTRAISDLRYELEHKNQMGTLATTPVAACIERRSEDWPVFTPIRKLDQVGPVDVIFVDNAFSLSAGTEAHVYAFAKECLQKLGRVVVVLVQ